MIIIISNVNFHGKSFLLLLTISGSYCAEDERRAVKTRRERGGRGDYNRVAVAAASSASIFSLSSQLRHGSVIDWPQVSG